ncbi:MAG: hypothetical protein F6K41_01090 [Symploca sp. SIO3E6]|nr:hypothetical protein [Caldora sp. SIO3E6]
MLFPIPNSQFPIPNSQFPIPNSQFPIPNSQFPIQNCPCRISDDRGDKLIRACITLPPIHLKKSSGLQRLFFH